MGYKPDIYFSGPLEKMGDDIQADMDIQLSCFNWPENLTENQLIDTPFL